MLTKAISCCMLGILLCAFSFAQDTTPQVKIKKRLTVSGRIVSKGSDTVLITSEAKGYILKPAENTEYVFTEINEFTDKDIDVTLSAIDTGETKGYRFFDHQTKKATEEKYLIISVTAIKVHQEGSTITNLDLKKPIDYNTLPKDDIVSPLKQVTGKISKFNNKSVLHTIELEGKEDFFLLITTNTQISKVAGDNLIAFKAAEILKVGNEVEIWYEEKGRQNIAHMILIQDKVY